MKSVTGERARRLLDDLLDRSERRRRPCRAPGVAGLTALIEMARLRWPARSSRHRQAGRTHLVRAMRDASLALLGAHGTLTGADAPLDGLVTDMAL